MRLHAHVRILPSQIMSASYFPVAQVEEESQAATRHEVAALAREVA